MRSCGNQNMAVACAVLLTVSAAIQIERADALAFSSVSSRIHSQQRLSRALTSPRRVGREKRTLLGSTAAPEQIASTRPTTTTDTPTIGQESIPKTMSDALHRFFLGPDKGPICVVGILVFMTAWRLSLAALTPVDAALFGGMALVWCIQEYVIHDKLLHSQFAWMGRDIHKAHHNKPYFHISLDPAWLMIAWLSTAHILFRIALPLPSSLSATLGYASFGLLYEWSHYIVHTRVKPSSAFWKRVRDNHIQHHLVDDRYWLSFTLPWVDNVFGTNPSVLDVKRRQSLKCELRDNGGRLKQQE